METDIRVIQSMDHQDDRLILGQHGGMFKIFKINKRLNTGKILKAYLHERAASKYYDKVCTDTLRYKNCFR